MPADLLIAILALVFGGAIAAGAYGADPGHRAIGQAPRTAARPDVTRI